MRFIADECTDLAIVEALRTNGHEVDWIGEGAWGSSDEEVIRLAEATGAVLVTDDKGFGSLVLRTRA